MTVAQPGKMFITKASGKRMVFAPAKLMRSLKRSGADEATAKRIVERIIAEAYDGISTQEIYQKAFNYLNQSSGNHAARYKLKRAIMDLGPTGFPFEVFIGKLFEQLHYKVKTGQVIKGNCVKHEVDVIAEKENRMVFAECKFHNRPGIKCDVKVPLYVHARFRDIEKQYQKPPLDNIKKHEGWLVTNTHFTGDAIQYGRCAGLHLLGWDYPQGNALKDMIDRMGLYPITCLSLLKSIEKQFLLDKNIVLCSELLHQSEILKSAGLNDSRVEKLMLEIDGLCFHSPHPGKQGVKKVKTKMDD